MGNSRPAVMYHIGQAFDCIGPFTGPFLFHEFALSYFYLVFGVIPLLVHTDCV